MLATSFAVGAVLVSVPAGASAQDTGSALAPAPAPASAGAAAYVQDIAPAPAPAPGVMASTGCDSTSGPPSGVDSHWQTYYGGGLFWGACVDCHADALMLGALGWRTWCWEVVAPSEVAALWYGRQIDDPDSGANSDMTEQFTRVASRDEITALLREAAESRR